MAKYTDEQIKKALECCINKRTMCKQCPLYSIDILNCNEKVAMAFALDLINRQEAEIERLTSNVHRLKQYDEERDIRLHARLTANAKSEAIKEFAESIKSYIDAYVVFEYAAGEQNLLDYIDNLVKEMVGESK